MHIDKFSLGEKKKKTLSNPLQARGEQFSFFFKNLKSNTGADSD